MTERLRVLIIGAAGVFGRRVAMLLKSESGLELLLSGRNRKKLNRLSTELNREGATTRPLVLDLARHDLAEVLAAQAIDLVIHTAGPFQSQNYDVPRACLRAHADLIDLADSGAYVSRIGRFDAEAKGAGCAVISGASSVPALSSAVVDALTQDFARLRTVTTRISPGNRAPRGRALVSAIASYAGRPIPGWAEGLALTRIGWAGLHRRTLQAEGARPLPRRWFADCEAPDIELFPQRYPGLEAVRFFAGLELSILHLGLWLLSWLPRLKLVRSLLPMAGTLKVIADLFRPFGSDRGGMTVEVAGRMRDGVAILRRWTLIAEAGDGPFVPCLAAAILVRRRLRGPALEPGAMPCLGLISLAEFEAAIAPLRVRTAVEQEPVALYRRALGDAYATLPAPLRAMHDVDGPMAARGEASVRRGNNPLAAFVALLFGLPPSADRIPVEVSFTPEDGAEIWRRRFGISRFRSTQYLHAPATLIERFGIFSFRLELRAAGEELHLVPQAVAIGRLPLPRALALRIAAAERVAPDGRFEFDVRIALPIIGELVHYRGRLSPPAPLL